MKEYNIPVIDTIATGNNIKRLREKSGIPVKELQGILGFSTPQAIYKWQCGDSMPTVDNLLFLSNIFGVSMDEIIIKKTLKGDIDE